MTAIKLEAFKGMIPKVDKNLLPQGHGQITTNCKLWSGAIEPVREPLLVDIPTKKEDRDGDTIRDPILSIYRMDDREGGGDFWLHWQVDVDAVRGLSADTRQRLYYTGDYEPRVTTYEMATDKSDTVDGSDNYPSGYGEAVATDYPRAFYCLGVHNPLRAPRVAEAGGTEADVTRSYVYTYVSAWGEESGPSPPTLATGAPDGTWTVDLMNTAPLNTGSIEEATHSGGVVTVYTDGLHWIRPYHRITISSAAGMTDLNDSFTVQTADNVSVSTVSRSRTSNVATLTLTSVEGLESGDTVVVAGVGGSSYNGTVALTGVTESTKTVTYASVATDEGNTTDTGGTVDMGKFTVDLTTAQSHTSGTGTWTRVAPWNVTGMTKRIYRTLTGTSDTAFQFVSEIAVGTTSYSDTVASAELGETLITEGFEVPPGNMIALADMPNGMMVGSVGNQVYFAQPFLPYAWPVVYTQKVNWPVVGLSAYGESLVVPTTGIPYIMTGVHPDNVTVDHAEIPYPCQSKRGIKSLGWAVVYPSDQGLAMISSSGHELVTRTFYNRQEWQQLANGGVFESAMVFDNRYYAFWTTDEGLGASLIFDPQEPPAVVTQNDAKVDAAWGDPETGKAYIVDDNYEIDQWDADESFRQVFQWKSALYDTPRPVNLGAGHIEADFTTTPEEQAAIEAENAARAARNAVLIAEVNSLEAWGVDNTPASNEELDKTTAFRDDTNNDFGPFNFTAAEAAGDFVAIGYAKTFNKVRFDAANGTQGVGAGLTTIWEYWDGTAWSALTGVTDGTSGFTAAVSDDQVLTFDIPTDWATTTISTSAALYFIRLRISAGDYSTNPLLDQGIMFRRPVLRGPFGSRTYGSIAYGSTILEDLIDAQNQFVQFEVIAAGETKYVVTCNSEQYFRLPGGYREHRWEFNITGNVRTRSVEVAETMKELGSV
jgi:hypothetical protein